MVIADWKGAILKTRNSKYSTQKPTFKDWKEKCNSQSKLRHKGQANRKIPVSKGQAIIKVR